jgi:hypothetical protein
MLLEINADGRLVTDVPGLHEKVVFHRHSIERVGEHVLKVAAYVDDELRVKKTELQEACSAGDFAAVQLISEKLLQLRKKAEMFDLVFMPATNETFKINFRR